MARSANPSLLLLSVASAICGYLVPISSAAVIVVTDGHSYAAVDAAIGQWQSLTAQSAVLADTGQTFAEVKKARASTATLDTRCSQAGTAKREAA